LAVEQQLRELRGEIERSEQAFARSEAELAAAKREFEDADEVVNAPLRRRERAWSRFTTASKQHSKLKDTLFQTNEAIKRLEGQLR
jgi:chromosome segregation ATPase